jgi:hypothetical protein
VAVSVPGASSSKRRRVTRSDGNKGNKKEVLAHRPLTRSQSAKSGGVQPVGLVLHDESMLEKIAQLINAGIIRSVVVVVGAGISTNAGIADFRSAG